MSIALIAAPAVADLVVDVRKCTHLPKILECGTRSRGSELVVSTSLLSAEYLATGRLPVT
jgi:hypothetical protein